MPALPNLHLPGMADEPVFLIRAQDQVGATAVRAWAHQHRVNGGSDPAFSLAMAHADKMEQWGKLHGTKAADVPPAAIPPQADQQKETSK